MGTYLYGAKKSKPVKASLNGENIVIHRLQYITKPHSAWFGGDEFGRIGRLIVGKLKSAWGDEVPQYVAVIDKDEKGKACDHQGVGVYKNPKSPFWYDCDKISEEFVGFLFMRGGKYVVVPVAEFNAMVARVTGYGDWCKMVSEREISADFAESDADFVVAFYKSQRMSGAVVAKSEFVG